MSYTANYVKPDVVTFGRKQIVAKNDGMRSAIMSLENGIKALPGVQLDCPVTNIFAPGVYARQMEMASGVCVVGKIHKHAHLNIISKGRVRVLTEFGEDTFSAPYAFVSPPGTKRVIVSEEDAVWTTIHSNETNTTDIDELERLIIAKDYEESDSINAVEVRSES